MTVAPQLTKTSPAAPVGTVTVIWVAVAEETSAVTPPIVTLGTEQKSVP